MRAFKLEYDLTHDYYRIVGPNGEEGEPVPFGYPADIEVGGRPYIAVVDYDPEQDEAPVIVLPVYLLGAEQRTVEVQGVDLIGYIPDEEIEEQGAAPAAGEEDEGGEEDEQQKDKPSASEEE